MRALTLIVIVVVLNMGAAPKVREVVVRHPNGQPATREFYAGERKVGHHEAWWPDGRPRRSAFYVNDALSGEYRTWRQDGTPYELRHFERGRESGLQQSWEADGTLFLNYIVRDGRRYGFINARPCEPADHGGQSLPMREP